MKNKDMSTQPSDAKEQYDLGNMYVRGQGVVQDSEQAFKWFTKSAEQGNQYAQGSLGMMYDNGVGVPQDYDQAIKWYTKSAEQGNSRAQYNLGCMRRA